MKEAKAIFFIILIVIILGVFIYSANGSGVHSVINTSVKNITKDKSNITENQKAELYQSQSQFMQDYYLVPTPNMYNTQTSK